MNQRIKELTGQVLDEIVPDTWTTLGYDKIKQIQYRTAELIVKECLGIVANADMTELEGPDPEDVLYVACKQIKEHFGVKE